STRARARARAGARIKWIPRFIASKAVDRAASRSTQLRIGGSTMEFMLLFMLPAGAPTANSEGMAEMSQFARDLAKRGKLRRGAPLVSDSEAVRVRVRDGEALVSDGPFAESKEVVGGFWIVDVANRAEAIEIAGRCPHAREGAVEVHFVQRRYTFTD